MNPAWKRRLILGVKLSAALLVLVFVAYQFQRDLRNLDFSELKIQPLWLLPTGVFYLLGLFPSAWFWRHLHGVFGYPITLYAAVRAHYIGQLGKYVPGKAMAIAIRSDLVHPFGVPYGVSIIASSYEVFTGMASGAILAALIFMIDPPTAVADFEWHPALIGLVLILLCGIPLLPAVFNLVIAKVTARIQAIELYRLPPIRFQTLAAGLLATSAGWWLHGLSVWSLLQAIVPNPPELSISWWAQGTAAIALATVAGFAAFFMPAGFGVREGILKILLSPAGAVGYIAAAVLLLRLDWVAAEMISSLFAYFTHPGATSRSGS